MKTTLQNAKMLRYSREEMLKEWKLRKGFTVGRCDCEIVRDDGIDLDDLLYREIDHCYARLLAEAPLDCVPVVDVAGDATVDVSDDLVAFIVLPENCVRVVEVKFPSWSKGVGEFCAPGSDVALRQQSPWFRGGVESPVCVASHRCIHCYSVGSLAEMPDKLLAVCFPEASFYLFAESAWRYLLNY